MDNKGYFEKRTDNYFDIQKEISPNIPKNMLLELSNICNHSCIFCANSKSTRRKSYISFDFAKRILKEAYDLGTREVGFYSTGEPLVNKDLEEYIKIAKIIGYDYIYITTNGALLNEERAKSLIDAGIDSIKFSINAGTRESYEIIHGKDEFEKVVGNLKYLFNYRRDNKKNFKIFISCILTKYTNNEKSLILNELSEYADDIVFLNCKNQCGVMYEVNKYLTIEENDNENNNICPLPFNKLHITCEGYLTACCADFQNYLVVADLNNETLKNAWNVEVFKEFRRKHIEHRLEGTLCYNCIHNVNLDIKPLNEKISIKYDSKMFDKTEEIIKRIKSFK